MNRQPIVVQKITALYSRLSKDDERAGESLSIEHQKFILEDYAKKQGFANLVHYTDDGFSGSDFSRPDWKRMIADVEADKVGTVICKDLSRLGRDHLQVGFHTEVVFRQHGVRFIAIGNNIDSDIQESTEFAPFLNIFSEWYARDCSRKIKTVLHAKGKSGKHMTNAALYGYKKSTEDKKLWLIDEEAAAVVRRIFQMTIDGKGTYQIARALTDDHVMRPSVYVAQRDGGTYAPLGSDDPYVWNGKTVENILDRPEYRGATVNFRTYKDSYKDKKEKLRPKEDWVIFEGTQEAIVSPETWETAQKCRKVKRRRNSTGKPNPLTGLVYCADCGFRLYNHRGSLAYKYDSQDSYACGNHTKYPPKCTMHYIRTSTLRTLALDAIRAVTGFVRENESEFVNQVREAHDLQSAEAAKAQQKQLARHQKRHKDLDGIIKQLFEDRAGGSLSAKRFEILSGEYEAEQDDLERQIAELQAGLDEYKAESGNTDQFIKLVRKYTEFPELTATILNEYIDKIVVSEADKSSGRREQTVDFYFNFVGKISIPGQAEEAEPFDPEEHRKAQFRSYYYRNRDEILAKKAAVREAERAAKLAAVPAKTPEELAAEEDARKERKRAYQREYQREWQRKRREQNAQKSA